MPEYKDITLFADQITALAHQMSEVRQHAVVAFEKKGPNPGAVAEIDKFINRTKNYVLTGFGPAEQEYMLQQSAELLSGNKPLRRARNHFLNGYMPLLDRLNDILREHFNPDGPRESYTVLDSLLNGAANDPAPVAAPAAHIDTRADHRQEQILRQLRGAITKSDWAVITQIHDTKKRFRELGMSDALQSEYMKHAQQIMKIESFWSEDQQIAPEHTAVLDSFLRRHKMEHADEILQVTVDYMQNHRRTQEATQIAAPYYDRYCDAGGHPITFGVNMEEIAMESHQAALKMIRPPGGHGGVH